MARHQDDGHSGNVDSGGLLAQAAEQRVAGNAESAKSFYLQAFDHAARTGDTEARAEAALGLAVGQNFGFHAGQLPALIHEAYRELPPGALRARLAAALARSWVYGGEPQRATPFADESVDLAESFGDAALLADALDAAITARWGPDQMQERMALARRLADTAAHLTDVEGRLSACLWCLTTAAESLDLVGVQRYLRALDLLAEESGSVRVKFFAASRRAMYALLEGDFGAAEELIDQAREAGSDAALADAFAVIVTLEAHLALFRADGPGCALKAAAFEVFGLGEGVPSISAEAAVLWVAGGNPDRARELLGLVAGAGLDGIHRDVDWLLTQTALLEVAAAVGDLELVESGIALLEPYAGRAVIDAGAVMFNGVVDDYLFHACAALGRDAEAEKWRGRAALAYQRLGARWWLSRVAARSDPVPQKEGTSDWHFHQIDSGLWTISAGEANSIFPDLRGFHYLHRLLLSPGEELTALGLAMGPGSREEAMVDTDAGDVIDTQARNAYHQRLNDLDEELAEADSWADGERSVRLGLERQALIDELAAATGLGGRSRRTLSNSERARVAVRKAISSAVARIEVQNPAMGRYLRDSIHTGRLCGYAPDPGRTMTWVLDGEEAKSAPDST